MIESGVIIIGGGAAGLISAREIAKKKKVIILEARNRLGGRIFTTSPKGFSIPLELGAEFIHGNLPITDALLKEANISHYAIKGETYQIKEGEIKKSGDVIEGTSVLSSKVKKLKKDIPFAEFLEKYFNEDKYREIRESSRRFVEGYDAADIYKASTLALSKEWESEGVSSPKRVEGGYGKIVKFLAEEIIKLGSIINLSVVVKEISWKKNKVAIKTEDGTEYTAAKVLVTVPAGVLKSAESSKAFIKFSPFLKEKIEALNSIGYGSVVKVFYEFKNAFWESSGKNHRRIRQPGIIITNTIFTAWWSQLPKKVPLLTGWFAGPNVDKMQKVNNNDLIEQGIVALSIIFDTKKSFINRKIKSRFVANWKIDPFSLGAYSYATVESTEAKKILNRSVEDTIFFAGEALSDKESMGTVEAAFESGLSAARKILRGG
jgi:monoamine oxidase